MPILWPRNGPTIASFAWAAEATWAWKCRDFLNSSWLSYFVAALGIACQSLCGLTFFLDLNFTFCSCVRRFAPAVQKARQHHQRVKSFVLYLSGLTARWRTPNMSLKNLLMIRPILWSDVCCSIAARAAKADTAWEWKCRACRSAWWLAFDCCRDARLH